MECITRQIKHLMHRESQILETCQACSEKRCEAQSKPQDHHLAAKGGTNTATSE